MTSRGQRCEVIDVRSMDVSCVRGLVRASWLPWLIME